MKVKLYFAILILFSLVVFSCSGKKESQGTSVLTAVIFDSHDRGLKNPASITLNDSIYISRYDSAQWKYVIDRVRPGQYKLSIKADGYQTQIIPDFQIEDSQKIELDIRLPEDWLVLEKEYIINPKKTATRTSLFVPGSKFKIAHESLWQNNMKSLDEPGSVIGNGYLSRYGDIASMYQGAGGGRGIGQTGFIGGCYSPFRWWMPYEMQFKKYEPNQFVKSAADPYSTFGADVSTASFTMIRQHLMNMNQWPAPAAVRTEELISYFDMKYAHTEGKLFSVHSDAMVSLVNRDCRLLRIGLQTRSISREESKPLVLTLAVDVSGSMSWWDHRFYLLRESMILLGRQLTSNDRAGIVTYGSDAKVLIEPTIHFDSVLTLINRLYADENYTNVEAGLNQSYRLAGQYFNKDAVNHVILCTDGLANKGQTAPAGLLKNIEQYRAKGIYLTVCGFGMNSLNDAGLEELATKGDGQYYFIDKIDEAQRVFSDKFISTMQIAAKDVQLQIRFDSSVVSEYRLIGYEKRDIPDSAFGKADGGEIGYGHHVTALYELKLKDTLAKTAGKVNISYKNPAETGIQNDSAAVILNAPSSDIAADELRFLSSVVLFAEILKYSPWGKDRSITEVRDILKKTGSSFRVRHPQYAEFAEMVYRAIEIEERKKGAKALSQIFTGRS